MALANLLLDADCRAKYRLDDFRISALLGLRPALTQVSFICSMRLRSAHNQRHVSVGPVHNRLYHTLYH